MTWQQEYIQLIEDCETREERLSNWERTFLDSLKKQLEQGRRPSAKQIECLDRAWENATKRG